MKSSDGRILAVEIGQEYPTVILWRVAQRVAVTGEAIQGYDPGPPHVTAQGQGGKSWNLHMGPTALRSTGYGKMASSSPQNSGPGHPLPQEPDPDDLGDRPHRT